MLFSEIPIEKNSSALLGIRGCLSTPVHLSPYQYIFSDLKLNIHMQVLFSFNGLHLTTHRAEPAVSLFCLHKLSRHCPVARPPSRSLCSAQRGDQRTDPLLRKADSGPCERGLTARVSVCVALFTLLCGVYRIYNKHLLEDAEGRPLNHFVSIYLFSSSSKLRQSLKKKIKNHTC